MDSQVCYLYAIIYITPTAHKHIPANADIGMMARSDSMGLGTNGTWLAMDEEVAGGRSGLGRRGTEDDRFIKTFPVRSALPFLGSPMEVRGRFITTRTLFETLISAVFET